MTCLRAGATAFVAISAIFAGSDVAWSQAPAQDDPTPFSEVQLVSSVMSLQPGTPFTVAVHITLDPGWHTYWTNGGDAGDELIVDRSLPEGFVAAELDWPAPHLLLAASSPTEEAIGVLTAVAFALFGGMMRSGIPLYVMYPSDAGAEPEVLPAVLTPGIVIDAVRRATEEAG